MTTADWSYHRHMSVETYRLTRNYGSREVMMFGPQKLKEGDPIREGYAKFLVINTAPPHAPWQADIRAAFANVIIDEPNYVWFDETDLVFIKLAAARAIE